MTTILDKRIAVIPARGGSKRIPRKNIRDFLGKPIIAYSIELAIQSKLFDEVMVSTDDSEIAEVGQKYGASVPFLRSSKNSNDHAGTFDVLEEVLFNYKKQLNKNFVYLCCIYPCAPLIQPKHLINGLEKLTSKQFKKVFPVVAYSPQFFRALKIDKKNNSVDMRWPEYLESRSQDLPVSYYDAGQWYWCKIDNQSKEFLSKDFKETTYIELTELEAQDIDNEIDWKMGEIKYQLLGK